MAKIKDITKADRPRERFLKMGPEALSKSDLLAILLGSGIKGTNVQELSEQIIRKFEKNFLNVTVSDLQEIPGIGHAKALQVVSAISLVKRFYTSEQSTEVEISSSRAAIFATRDLRNEKKDHLVCLYLNAKNILLRKETFSVSALDRALPLARDIFYPATALNATGVILVRNHPFGDPTPSEKDIQILGEIAQAGEIVSVPVIDFVITSKNGNFSFCENLKNQNREFHYVADGVQGALFDLLEISRPTHGIIAQKIQDTYMHIPQIRGNHFQLHNRRYIGNKYKLINWIFSILGKECRGKSFTDIFAGTGAVAAVASKHFDKIVLNDFLHSNYAIYKAFFDKGSWSLEKISSIIKNYNNISGEDLNDNYFSANFGGKYFSVSSAKVIGFIRENIEENRERLTEREYNILIASLIYSVDKIANTVGHYDAYLKKGVFNDNFFMRSIDPIEPKEVTIFREDANKLAKEIQTDVVYIDPPYNSRQYSRFYHILETLTKWDKPNLHGIALKPEPENMSDYCRVNAKYRLAELVNDIRAKYLAVSYNNTYDSKSNSSQNRIKLEEIRDILNKRGETKIFERNYRHFSAGNTDFSNHKEYLFVTCVKDHQKN